MPKRGSRHYHGDNDEDSDGSLGGDSGDSDGASIKYVVGEGRKLVYQINHPTHHI